MRGRLVPKPKGDSKNSVRAVFKPPMGAVSLCRVRDKMHEPMGWQFQHATGGKEARFGASQGVSCNVPWLLNAADMAGEGWGWPS